MAYIGTTPTKVVSRQSVVDYRYTATAGQTAFTGADLNNQVLACNPADMDVRLNGVTLDLTDWTATATTLTLAVAATAGDEVTVAVRQTFEVADTYAKTTADDRFVNAAGDTMTGALVLDKQTATSQGAVFNSIKFANSYANPAYIASIDAYKGYYDNNIGFKFNTQVGGGGGSAVSLEAMTIDASGNVTMPYQPSFYAFPSVGGWVNSANVLAFGTLGFWDANYNPSLYRFTAPVAGKYLFSSGILISGLAAHAWLRVNGNQVTNFGHTGASNANEYNYQTASVVYGLSAGDYVDVYQQAAYTSGSGIYMGGNYSYFSGYLIG